MPKHGTEAEEMEIMPEVELSSDSEQEDDDEVSLIVLKRPPLVKRTIQDLEVLDPTERSSATGKFTAKERQGIVKEYIETEGLGMILSKDMGLVLFHLDSVWIEGKLSSNGRLAKEKLYPGSEVTFVVRSFKGDEYEKVSEEKVLHQAVAVWYGSKPSNLMKFALGEENTRKLEGHRKTFMLYVQGEVFIRLSLMRVKAEVAGYLTDNLGIIEYTDENNEKHNILFHADNVKIFKKDMSHYRGPCKRNLPVGCVVKVDARRIHISEVKNVQYQAILVLAGSWPAIPWPSLLKGGKGTLAPGYEVPEDFTFYYLELPLENQLKRKVDKFKAIIKAAKGRVEYDWRDVEFIRNKDDFIDWKQQMGGREDYGDRGSFIPRSLRDGPRDVLDTFKACDMAEEELAVKMVTREVDNRTWYSPEAWQHGGLRIKPEVKDEAEDPSAPSPIPTKRPRLAANF